MSERFVALHVIHFIPGLHAAYMPSVPMIEWAQADANGRRIPGKREKLCTCLPEIEGLDTKCENCREEK